MGRSRQKVRFAWKPTISGREQWKWGLWLRVPNRKGRVGGIKFMVRGILIWVFSLAAFAYFAAASAWFFTLNQRPSNLVTWNDCVLAPFRWQEIRNKRGDAYISEGLASMEAKKWNEAIHKIQVGLGSSPNNRQGRRQLGLFFVVVGQRERGLDLLSDGFENYYPGREDLELLARLSVEGDDFNRAIRVIEKSLNHSGRAVERDRDWIRDQMVRVLMLGKRYEGVLTWINSQDSLSEIMKESRVVSFIELDDFENARMALDEWQKIDGRSSAVQRIRVRLAREERSLEEMRTTLDEMRSLDPTEPQSWVYSVIQELLADEPAAAKDALDSYLLRFGGKLGNLMMIAEPLVQIEAWEFFEIIENRFIELGLSDNKFNRLRCELAIARGEFFTARELLRTYEDEAGESLSVSDQRWLDTTSSMVGFLATGEDTYRADMIENIQNTPFSLSVLKSVADTLMEQRTEAAAFDVLSLARQRFPNSKYLNQNFQVLENKLGAQTLPEVEIPLVQDGTSVDLESEIVAMAENEKPLLAVQSAKQFLSQSRRMIENESWSKLSEVLREIRRVRPIWVSGYREEITLCEVALNTAEKNWPALVSNVRSLLDGTVPRALTVMGIVRHLDSLGERQTAESILAEIERRHAGFPPARRLKEEWAPEVEEADTAETPPVGT